MINPRYLLDTDICIYIKKHRPAGVRARMDGLPYGAAVMSAITWGELAFGARQMRTEGEFDRVAEALDELARVIPVLTLSRQCADQYGRLRALLARAGTPIGPNDLWIASHALSENLTLVTNNEREFRRVPGLKVENWVTGA